MTENHTQQAIEADFVDVTNAPDNVTPNVSPTLVFPLTRQKTAAALDISAMSVKRWIDALASHGRLCTDSRGKVTASGYEELHALAIATRENGLTLAQYLETLPAEEELESVLPVETVALSIVEAHRDQVSAITNRSLSREAALKSEFFGLLEEERADQAFERDIDEMRLAQVREQAYREFLQEEREALRIKRELKAMKLKLQMEGKQ
jgi:hypothetical protein